MEKEANQLYRRPQMTGQARDEEEDIGYTITDITIAYNCQYLVIMTDQYLVFLARTHSFLVYHLAIQIINCRT